jgi:hypothetical protein
VSLHRIEARLRTLLRDRGRSDLERLALDRVGFTDDGTSLYVHVLAKASWPHRRPGQAYVLAFAEKVNLTRLSDMRALLHDAGLQLEDEVEDIIRWFDGK